MASAFNASVPEAARRSTSSILAEIHPVSVHAITRPHEVGRLFEESIGRFLDILQLVPEADLQLVADLESACDGHLCSLFRTHNAEV